MRTSLLLFFPLTLSLLACGRSTIEGPEDLPSVVDQTAGSSGTNTGGTSAGGSSAGGTSSGGTSSGGSNAGGAGNAAGSAGSIGGAAGAGNNGGSGGAGNAAGSAGAGAGGVAGTGGAGGAGNGGAGNAAGSAGAGAVSGSGGAGNGGAGGGVTCPGGLPIPDSLCESCIDTQCCGESQGCGNDASCLGLFDCLINCNGSDVCSQQCVNKFPEGIPRLQLLGQCIDASCGVACGSGGSGGSGGVGGSGGSGGVAGSAGAGGGPICEGSLPIPLPACKNCLDAACCGESQNCNASPQCGSLLTCFIQCNGNSQCQQQCLTKFPGGLAEAQQLGQCAESAGCSALCSGGGGTGGSAGAGGTGGAGAGGSAGAGAGGAAGSGGGQSCEALSTGDPVCDTCYQAQCCDQGSACVDSPACIEAINCFSNCSDGLCQQKCFDSNPEGANLLFAVVDCINGPCGASCNGGTGGAGGGTGGSGGSGGVAGTAGAGGSTAICGDGKLDDGEQCDNGSKNTDTAALRLFLSGFPVQITPIFTGQDVQSFYGYSSASSHTGFEDIGASRVILFQNPADGQLSLILTHGIDKDSSGLSQPNAKVQMKIAGPTSMFVQFADDSQQELSMQGPGAAFGDWSFNNNSDGGILGGLPFPGDWTVDLGPSFQQGIKVWTFIDGQGNFFDLGLNNVVTIESRSSSKGLCRLDCSVPTCGDGQLDAGEQCDDGNPSPGDGCSPDCTLDQPILF